MCVFVCCEWMRLYMCVVGVAYFLCVYVCVCVYFREKCGISEWSVMLLDIAQQGGVVYRQ